MLLMVGGAASLSAQSNLRIKADKAWAEKDYARAIKLYEKQLEKEDDPVAQFRLAESYRNSGQSDKASTWFGKAAESDALNPAPAFEYAASLHKEGNYTDAKYWYGVYVERGGDPRLGAKMIGACETAAVAMQDSGKYKISPLEFSTKYSEIGAVPYAGGFLVAAARKRGAFTELVDGRNGGRTYDLYLVKQKKPGKYSFEMLKGGVNSRFHEGPAVIDPRTGDLYFTRSYVYKGRKRSSENGEYKLSVMRAKKRGKGWGKPEALPFNDPNFSCGHPGLSRDGQVMVFASDMPGGLGGTDLYVTVRTEEDSWSEPVNLGEDINTPRNELFPAILPDGMLAFSSEGHGGLGGLDIFVAEALNGVWGKPQNAGYPLNGNADDFSLYWIPGTNRGMFASNREGGPGLDDIYLFVRKIEVKGTLTDAMSGDQLEDVKISVSDDTGNSFELISNEKGDFSFFADPGREFNLLVEGEHYQLYETRISTRNFNPLLDFTVDMDLQPEYSEFVAGTVLDPETGEPVAGESLVLIWGNGTEIEVNTDEKGNYYFPLPDSIREGDPSFLSESPIAYRNSSGEEIDYFDPNQSYTYRLPGQESNVFYIDGYVVDRIAGLPVANSKLQLIWGPGMEIRVQTDEEGNYFTEVPAKYRGESFWKDAPMYYVDGQGEKHEYDAELGRHEATNQPKEEVYFSGTLTDPITGLPVSNQKVTLTWRDGRQVDVETNEEGKFVHKVPGSFFKEGEDRADFELDPPDFYTDASGNHNFRDADGSFKTSHPRREGLMVIRGIARDPISKYPLTDQTVEFGWESGESFAVETDAEGNFSKELTEELKEEDFWKREPDFIRLENGEKLRVKPGDMVYLLPDNVEPGLADGEGVYASEPKEMVSGILHDPETGEPIRNQMVKLIYPDGSSLVVQTDENGRYNQEIPASKIAEGTEFWRETPEMVTFRSGETFEFADVSEDYKSETVYPPGAAQVLAGTLIDPVTGEPVANQNVSLILADGSEVMVETDENGNYSIPWSETGLPARNAGSGTEPVAYVDEYGQRTEIPNSENVNWAGNTSGDPNTYQAGDPPLPEFGEYLGTTARENAFPEEKESSTWENQPTDPEARHLNNETVPFAGALRDPGTGRPIPDAQILVSSQDGYVQEITTDAEGNFDAVVLPGEIYGVAVAAPGYKPFSKSFRADADETHNLMELGAFLEEGSGVLVEGRVTSPTGEPVQNTSVRVKEADSEMTIRTVKTDEDGRFELVVEGEGDKYLEVGNEFVHFVDRQELPAQSMTEVVHKEISLVKMANGALAKVVRYPSGSEMMLPAREDLWGIFRFMESHPESKVEIGIHTDATGSAADNLSLSRQRAAAVKDFLIQNGIGEDRVFAMGYGEKVILNECTDGVSCSEEQHAINRRAEFRIVGVDYLNYR